MTYRLSTRHTHFVNTPHGEVQVDFQPAYDGYILHERVGDKLVVAYLVHDDDHRDIDDMMGDGMGQLFDRRSRYANKESEALEALGMDRYGDAKLEQIFYKHFVAVLPRYIEKVLAAHSVEDIVASFQASGQECEGDSERPAADLAVRLLKDEANSTHAWSNVLYESEMQAVLEKMFEEPEYFPGDIDAVLCDVYEHGGSMWSVHGGGMRCQWDTSRGAGVWVPDDCLRSELADVNPWAFVRTPPLTMHGTGNKYQLVEIKWNEAGPVHVDLVSLEISDDFRDLYDKANLLRSQRPEATAKQKAWARSNQAEIYARQYLAQYNDIINGNVYGCVVQTYDLKSEDEDEWVEAGSLDDCWGFIGSDYAMETLKDEYLEPAVRAISQEVPA